ncbi:hypothetical protein [Marispirochaeta sp.]|uniref:hypothetical protein n=1 Tax=Marispirochaeta sp. TaxID=2038653 RepID=UPI0029C70B71|nr:hypothetical protein [Marispirochaeta sp.]
MFRPPFCPNRDCQNHPSDQSVTGWYVKNGSYQSRLFGKIQRFHCKHCGAGFSSQTFSIDFFAKRKLPYRTIFSHLFTSSGIRDTARILKVSPTTITNRISRLARQAIAIHASLSAELHLTEDLAADGFESFVLSQYFPNNINLLVGKESQFWFSLDYAHLRRKGRMTEYQKKRNIQMQARFNLHRRSIYRSFQELVRVCLDLQEQSACSSVQLFTDEHLQYAKVYRDLTAEDQKRIHHRRISSKLPRTLRNDLFSVNYLDREIRKDSADHTRETVRFARNASNCMERLAIYRLYHNYCKPYRIAKQGDNTITHAERAGILAQRIKSEMKTLFTRRRFFSRMCRMSSSDRMIWLRSIVTPMKITAEYLPAYAYS